MTALATLLFFIVWIVWLSPKSLGRWLAQVMAAMNEERKE